MPPAGQREGPTSPAERQGPTSEVEASEQKGSLRRLGQEPPQVAEGECPEGLPHTSVGVRSGPGSLEEEQWRLRGPGPPLPHRYLSPAFGPFPLVSFIAHTDFLMSVFPALLSKSSTWQSSASGSLPAFSEVAVERHQRGCWAR